MAAVTPFIYLLANPYYFPLIEICFNTGFAWQPCWMTETMKRCNLHEDRFHSQEERNWIVLGRTKIHETNNSMHSHLVLSRGFHNSPVLSLLEWKRSIITGNRTPNVVTIPILTVWEKVAQKQTSHDQRLSSLWGTWRSPQIFNVMLSVLLNKLYWVVMQAVCSRLYDTCWLTVKLRYASMLTPSDPY